MLSSAIWFVWFSLLVNCYWSYLKEAVAEQVQLVQVLLDHSSSPIDRHKLLLARTRQTKTYALLLLFVYFYCTCSVDCQITTALLVKGVRKEMAQLTGAVMGHLVYVSGKFSLLMMVAQLPILTENHSESNHSCERRCSWVAFLCFKLDLARHVAGVCGCVSFVSLPQWRHVAVVCVCVSFVSLPH